MNSLLKYPGAKWKISKWICSFFPHHNTYLEPYFGSGAIYFNKQPAKYETINDIDGRVINLFTVCRDNPEKLAELLYFTPYARDEYEMIKEDRAGESIKLTGDNVEDARRFIIRCSMGYGSKLADRVGWKNTKHSSGPVNPKVFNKLPETVFQVCDRLKNAQIENRPAFELIKSYNASDCLIYADPPYLGSTRTRRMYSCEMMRESEHIDLLKVLLLHNGPVVLSGYDNNLYNEYLKGWRKEHKITTSNNATSRIECLWMNF